MALTGQRGRWRFDPTVVLLVALVVVIKQFVREGQRNGLRSLAGGCLAWDFEATEKTKVYDRGISRDPNPEHVYQMRIGYRTGDTWAPPLAVTEALSVEAQQFMACVRDGVEPITGGESGLHGVRAPEAATASMAGQGRLVDLWSMAQS